MLLFQLKFWRDGGELTILVMSIAKGFEENGHLVPKHIGGVCCTILQDEHSHHSQISPSSIE